jgi:GST-like protein
MIELYTANTPNGVKIPIALEELGLPYRLHRIDLGANQQKTPEFLAINPNGRIPAIVDTEGPGDAALSVFESGAILLYLADKQPGLLMPSDPVARVRALEYLFFQMGGIGPMFGQAGWFMRHTTQIPLAIERYQSESKRLTAVLESRLTKQPWLAGASYSIADIANFGWLRGAAYAGIDLAQYPAVRAWLAAIEARPAVQRALAIF